MIELKKEEFQMIKLYASTKHVDVSLLYIFYYLQKFFTTFIEIYDIF